MSATLLMETLEKLDKLHSSLYEIAVKKTEVIKNGDIESLNGIMKEENKHMYAINKLEEARQKAAQQICPEKEQPTVSDCLEKVSGSEHESLLASADKLASRLADLKEQNYLNQQMLHNSLQFVHFSLNLLRPQPAAINYAPPTKKTPNNPAPGMFNSKA
ncbi:flagellar protein FlgN [Bacillus benzoevorans]|uniref:Flagellar biosynthesis/type III secretory pathway chaperone n=1 Tax=Bacillus benzoevorans TaxID=1456 RepID=A0A7X0LX60_9BACI|nr:flagellar protein FlgN [Bacillus benzoevorans]MBB6447280.1 flagellar biosynthesis/type III secretory pathway chaperone [Bacillus benzoevorans]